jgi:hypothetical protein
MDDQKILDSTPAGNYTNVSMSNGKPFIWACNNFRSLADIKELVELRKANAELVELRKANAELVTRIAKAELAFAIVEGRNAELEKERELMLEVIKAVAHVGVDFEFGVYQLEDYRIKQSREILEALKAGN